MLGRKIYSDPTFLLNVDKEIYSQNTNLEFNIGIRAFMTYILNLSNPKDVNRSINHLIQIIEDFHIPKILEEDYSQVLTMRIWLWKMCLLIFRKIFFKKFRFKIYKKCIFDFAI